MKSKRILLNNFFILGFKPAVTVIVVSMMTTSCSPVSTTSSTGKDTDKGSAISGDASSQAGSTSTNTESALALPSWCRMNQSSDQVCFHCTRTDDSIALDYEQCLTPSNTFRASSDCWFSDQVTKSISCIGTRSGEAFTMDVSTAKEKVSATLPVLLIALNLTVIDKFGPTSSVSKFVGDMSTFLGSRIQQIMRSEDLPGVSGDLAILVNKYTTSSMSDQETELFKNTSTMALTWMVSSLSGKKDYDLSKVLLKVTDLSRSIHEDKLGDAKQLLSGQGMADLLSDNNSQALIRIFKILGPSVAGANSPEQLIQRLKHGN